MVSVKTLGVAATVVLAIGGGALWLLPSSGPSSAIKAHDHAPKPPEEHDHEHRDGGHVRLAEDQIATAKIEVSPAGPGVLVRRLTVPGTTALDGEKVGRVAAKVIGTVAELRKRLGDPVAKGELLAVLDSREVADAKSDYLAAVVQLDLQRTLYDRDRALYDKRIVAEQQFLRTRNVFRETELRVNVARQKLAALDLSDAEVASLTPQQTATLRRKEIRAPLAGQIVERRVDPGSPVGREGQESEIYVIADLSSLWVDLFVPMSDLGAVKPGQTVAVAAAGRAGDQPTARIIFVSPLLHPETRSARVVAALDNADLALRPGEFVTARIAVAEWPVAISVPLGALQTIEGEPVVFVRTAEGFEKRVVTVGQKDEARIEIVAGLEAGEAVAMTNTFVLKAELAKGEGGHDHVH